MNELELKQRYRAYVRKCKECGIKPLSFWDWVYGY